MLIERKGSPRSKLTLTAAGDIRVKIERGLTPEQEQQVIRYAEWLANHWGKVEQTKRLKFLYVNIIDKYRHIFGEDE